MVVYECESSNKDKALSLTLTFCIQGKFLLVLFQPSDGQTDLRANSELNYI